MTTEYLQDTEVRSRSRLPTIALRALGGAALATPVILLEALPHGNELIGVAAAAAAAILNPIYRGMGDDLNSL